MKPYIIPLFLFTLSCFGQTNLIPNASFERLDPVKFAALNNGACFYDSHFGIEDGNNSSGLFECCWYAIGHIVGGKQGVQGYSWAIAPDLFTIASGSGVLQDHPAAVMNNEVLYDEPARILYQNSNSYLPLNYNSTNETYGFDLSPPNSYFGENVNATDGTNYVALFDVENEQYRAKPKIACDLKYDLAKGVKYKFSIDFAKMNLLGYIKEQGGWGLVRDGKLKVWVCSDDYSPKQLIMSEEVESNDWTAFEVEFEAERSYTRLMIEYDPIDWGGANKIGGAFIDHLKLYEACETPENQCDNSRYKRDMLDVNMEQASVNSPDAYGDLRTLRLYKIDHAKYVKVYIYSEDMSILHRTFEMYYPGTEWYWDGKDDNGVPLPDDKYKARLQYAYNECYAFTDFLEKEFDLERDYSVFNPAQAYYLLEDGNGLITGLGEVHEMQVKIYTITGQGPLYNFTIINPRPALSFSINSLEALPGNQTLEPANYRIELTLSNNCATSTFVFNNHPIVDGIPDAGGQYSTYFDYSPIPKPAVFSCPFNFVYRQNVYSPMNCCEGYLHLENMEIWNSWGEVNIQDSILIGPNVVFEPGTYNYLNAGEQIVFLPDSNGVVVLGTGIFKPNTFECEICKNYTFESLPDEEVDDDGREIVYTNVDSLAQMRSVEMIVYPNPSPGDQEITVLAGSTDIDPRKYRLVLSDPLGKPVEIKVTTERTDMLRFRPASPLSPGAYYLYYESNGEQETFNVVIR